MSLLALGLGSNLGNRMQQINQAVDLLEDAFMLSFEQSSVYETAPWGIEDQPSFLNMVIVAEVDADVREIFNIITSVEREMGKSKEGHWRARNIDVDCLFFGDTVVDSIDWKLPHPELQNRNFVLIPLLELIPDWIHPILEASIEDLYWNCEDTAEVVLMDNVE